MPSEKDTKNKRDDFWDIELLLPPKKPTPPLSAHLSSDTSAVEIALGSKDESSSEVVQDKQLNLSQSQEKNRLIPECEYQIKGGLISKVKISRWNTKYSFYEKFRADALTLHRAQAKEVSYIPFFSYTPQYKQLNRGQLEWYLWWRENVRSGIYLKSSYSYLLLYIYEIINLPDLIPPQQGAQLLCDVWLAYRDQFHRIDKYLAEWLCDYCLIHRLPLPKERLDPIITEIIDKCSFREFYMHFDESACCTYSELLIKFASNYNWRGSKYATQENIPLFEKHLIGAIASILSNDKENTALGHARAGSLCRTSRDAFSGSLCAHNIKRRIEIYYYSFTRSYSLRLAVTNIVKYTENRLRSRLGIKSRLAVSSVSSDAKQIIDNYLDIHLPGKNTRTVAAPKEPDYMKAYEAQSDTLSPERALDIEHRSWQTTQLLVDALEDEDKKSDSSHPNSKKEDGFISESNDETQNRRAPDSHANAKPIYSDSSYKTLLAALNPVNIEFLRLAVFGEKGEAERMARERRALPEQIADTINELAVDICGDILLEDDSGYSVIDDYYEEIKKCLNPI